MFRVVESHAHNAWAREGRNYILDMALAFSRR